MNRKVLRIWKGAIYRVKFGTSFVKIWLQAFRFYTLFFPAHTFLCFGHERALETLWKEATYKVSMHRIPTRRQAYSLSVPKRMAQYSKMDKCDGCRSTSVTLIQSSLIQINSVQCQCIQFNVTKHSE